MKEIPLNHGYVTLVDDEDVGKVSIGTWRLRRNKNALYAVRSLRKGGHRTLYLHRFILDPPPHLLVGLYALVGVAMFVEHRLAANYGRRGRK